MTPAQKVSGVLAAASLAIGTIAAWEGQRNVGYGDKLAGNLPTACFGATQGVVIGRRYTDDQCMAMLARDAVSHGVEIARCLPDELPVQMRAAFTSAAYNIGSGAFCKSSMSRKAMAGDYTGACNALSLWTKAGGREVRGLVNRRAAERALCLEGAVALRRAVAARPQTPALPSTHYSAASEG